MKVKMKRGQVRAGGDLIRGKVYDLPEKEAKLLVALNRAEALDDVVPPKK